MSLRQKLHVSRFSEEQLEELVATMHEFEESTKTDNVKKVAEADVSFTILFTSQPVTRSL